MRTIQGLAQRLHQLYQHPWRSWLIVALVLSSFVFNALWLWGIFWLWWALICIQSGEVLFLDRVARTRDPILFWVMISCWIILGAFYLMAFFYPQLLEY